MGPIISVLIVLVLITLVIFFLKKLRKKVPSEATPTFGVPNEAIPTFGVLIRDNEYQNIDEYSKGAPKGYQNVDESLIIDNELDREIPTEMKDFILDTRTDFNEKFETNLSNEFITNSIINLFEKKYGSIKGGLSVKSKKKIDKFIKYNTESDIELFISICEDIIHKAPEILEMPKLNVMRYIVNRSQDKKTIDFTYKEIEKMAKNGLDPKVMANAVDILGLSNNSKYRENVPDLLASIRVTEDRLNDIPDLIQEFKNHHLIGRNEREFKLAIERKGLTQRPEYKRNRTLLLEQYDQFDLNTLLNLLTDEIGGNFHRMKKEKRKKTVYEDSQNVHTKDINDAVLETAKKLIKKYPTSNMNSDISIPNDKKKQAIDVSIHRLKTDPSVFKHGLTLYQIYNSLLECIKNHPERKALEDRLNEELYEMSGQCTTGHLSRLINVISGFSDLTENLGGIKLSITDEVYASISKSLNKELETAENSLELMNGMVPGISKERKLYLKFIKDTSDKLMPMLNRGYEMDVTKSVVEALNRYCSESVFLEKHGKINLIPKFDI